MVFKLVREHRICSYLRLSETGTKERGKHVDVQQYNATMAAVDEENPKGAWAGAPSLASSTVDMTNTSGYPVLVYIAGAGTITVVKVDGATTGLVSTTAPAGHVRLRRGGKLNITYSVAPTLHWVYE